MTTTEKQQPKQQQQSLSGIVRSARQAWTKVMDLRRNPRSRDNAASAAFNAGRKKSPPELPGENELEFFLQEAEYEVHQDPYRGLQAHQQSIETGTTITTPWNACLWGTLQPEYYNKETNDNTTDSTSTDTTAIVRHVGHCACPSLKAWTQTAIAQKLQTNNTKKRRGKKRARLSLSPNDNDDDDAPPSAFPIGTRPTESNYRCLCDYNPLCLATLGGVINDVLTERSKQTVTTTTTTTTIVNGQDKENSIEQIQLNSYTNEDTDTIAKKPSTLTEGRSVLEQLPTAHHSGTTRPDKEVIRLDVDEEEEQRVAESTEEINSTVNDDSFAFAASPQRESTKTVTVQMKPLMETDLESKDSDIDKGDPAQVFFQDNIQSLHLPQGLPVDYSPATADLLKGLRHSVRSDDNSIRFYVREIILSNDSSDWSVNKYMESIQRWQTSLKFDNPVDVATSTPLDENNFTLSVPPGIENLGATCYLNTQLQCLAQNLAFLHGIFSWRLVNSSHNMNAVMSKLQLLLAQMVLGGDCKLSTRDFSNALGLEHYEQQDPNEFARLLFDRMDESFQQCADKDNGLANLLKRIFHGVTTYETICMTCKHASERREGFMDLNLPIVKQKKIRDGKITNFFGANATNSGDTNVQYCLDQYLCEEILDGDNQYHCSACDCKRDAKRVMKLTELPPVLNVQLSRYVFDRQRYIKKKLMDKVLIPTILKVGTERTYRLCAVMRHIGTSAYSGHYVAEAMDWLTGQWFEFNDELVKLLPDGPSCSYDPSHVKDETNGGTKTVTGSQDAYNMYYVDEAFLAKAAVEELSRREALSQKEPNNAVLLEVSKQRGLKYKTLSEMCFADGQKADRLKRRKTGLRNFMFHRPTSLVPKDLSQLDANPESSPVWVDGEFLRRYLSLENVFDDATKMVGPILRHKHLLCDHQRLHPRVARKGKLIPRSIYEAYTSLLMAERDLLWKEAQLPSLESPANDYIITPAEVICGECSKSYRDELLQKLDQIRNIKDLYDHLCRPGAKPQFFLDDEENLMSDDDSFVYALSKANITIYLRAVKALMKTLANVESGGVLDKDKLDQKTLFEGLDSIDLSAFQNGTGDNKNDEPLDKFFNSNITCEHGKCNVLNNGRRVRFLSWEGWQKVKKVFPDAIEHKKRRMSEEMAESFDSSMEECPECLMERALFQQAKSKLENWGKATQENSNLKALLSGNRTISREIEVHNFTMAKSNCRLVHKLDIESWQKSLRAVKSGRLRALTNMDELKARVEKIAFPSQHAVVLEFERQPVGKLVTSLRSLICREHQLVIESAIFQVNGSSGSPDEGEGHFLSDCIAVLSEEEYLAYISSLAELLHILHPKQEDMQMGSVGSPVLIDNDKTLLKEIRRITDSYHPYIRCVDKESSSDEILKFSLNGSSKVFQLSPNICRCLTCKNEFAPMLPVASKEDDKIESISVDSNDPKAQSGKESLGSGIVPTDAIIVESDTEVDVPKPPGTFPLRVFEVKHTAPLHEALESLQTASALPSEVDSSNSIASFLRRSTRKRKTRYPVGCVLSESSVNVGLHHNMAALRLLMYEKCEVALSGRKLTLVLSCDGKPHKTQDIKFEWGEKQLKEIVDEMKGESNGDSDVDVSTDLLLFHQTEDNGQSTLVQESVMESLIQLANLEAPDQAKQGKNRKRNRASERGFQGTLLQSSAPAPSNQDGDTSDKKPPPKPDVSTISDEDKKSPPKVDISAITDDENNEEPPQKKQRAISFDEASSKSSVEERELLTQSPFVVSNTTRPSLSSLDYASSNTSEGEHELLTRRPFAPSKQKPPPVPEASVPQVIVNDPSDEEEPVDHSQETIEIEDEPEIDGELQYEVLQELAKIIGELDMEVDESKCWDAASWAVKEHPKETKKFLLDTALAKYFE